MNFTADAIVNGTKGAPLPQIVSMWQDRTISAYRSSGIFSEVRSYTGGGDVRVDVHIEDRGDASIGMAVLTGLTLYLIPSKATDELIMQTTFKDADGNLIATIEKSETLTLWQQFFLIFAMAGKLPRDVVEATIDDLNYATINEAHAKGIF